MVVHRSPLEALLVVVPVVAAPLFPAMPAVPAASPPERHPARLDTAPLAITLIPSVPVDLERAVIQLEAFEHSHSALGIIAGAVPGGIR